jgi:hypothetical protein
MKSSLTLSLPLQAANANAPATPASLTNVRMFFSIYFAAVSRRLSGIRSATMYTRTGNGRSIALSL